MKKLDYKCGKCGEKQIVKLKSMLDKKPDFVKCEKCNGKATYDYEQLKSSTTLIPAHMKATNESGMRYNKMDRSKRKFM